MSSHAGLDAISALSHATRVAQAHSHVDIHSTVRQCAANQTHIFVVPVRYALSTCAVSHPAIQPGIGTQSHPLAARLLRTGYVYVWQGAGHSSVMPWLKTTCCVRNTSKTMTPW